MNASNLGLIVIEQPDELILSTLPAGISRWLGMDLPKRLTRITDVPITVVITERNPDE